MDILRRAKNAPHALSRNLCYKIVSIPAPAAVADVVKKQRKIHPHKVNTEVKLKE